MTAYGKFTDNELASLIKEDDQVAYTEVFLRYSKLLVAHAYRLLGDQDEANDVVQDVLLTLWQNRESIALNTSLSSYLYTAIRNRVFNRMSHQKIVAKYADSIVNFMEVGHAVTDELIRVKELAIIIEQEIAALPPKMREVYLLSKREELSYKEIALKLEITDKTAKQQVYNAVKNLRLKITSIMSILPFL
ncbi:RNA polymerase sigma factor [Mucilaginibacter sp. X5P1]|uniref:RNA polymerase sigma factor n=1 Tax=Mucilaginibacter sp. X5P1 TaxID=2723088 RepID=UPI0016098A8B|nr:RNA polymerase sigma-70 factor [Mucilaginibacter sp. X5P1]MBB6137278.1 RNA polymerase sigma-70 factor (ECF subfamily) [Mucilaginibacter sp. X5P1]